MNQPNWANKTIFTGDNLPIMRRMNTASVDLIYLDPPFNSDANYAAPIGSKAAGAEFKDTWNLTDLDGEWIDIIREKHKRRKTDDDPPLFRAIMAATTDSDKSYLVYMAIRMLEMKRILKETGSIYLHCDPTMSHYLKVLMDVIFGRRNFQSEISWKRNSSHNDSSTYGNIRDIILFYSQTSKINVDAVRVEHDPEYIKKFFRYKDQRGVYRTGDLSAKGLTGGGYEYDFHGHMGPWRYPEQRMRELEADGRIHLPKKPRGVPALRRYLHENKGKPLSNLWNDIPPVQGRAKESTRYPTQKPIALLTRIIKASSKEGDVVFDPFCGCATTLAAADALNRQWIGIDLSAKAVSLIKQRIMDQQGLFREIVPRTDILQRTDMGRLASPRTWLSHLYGIQDGNCAGCGNHHNRQVDFDVDHVVAKSKGGTDHIDNLQLLCRNCNVRKGDRGMEYLRRELRMTADIL